VTAERERLGESHPLFITQYRLMPLFGGGGYLSPQQRGQLQGDHTRKHRPDSGKVYVAGIDLAGEAEQDPAGPLVGHQSRQDATVVTIGELDFTAWGNLTRQPRIGIVEHYWWRGRRHTELYWQLVDILKNVWRCRRVVVDATGVGQPVSSFLRQELGSRVIPFTFTAASKSALGFNLLAAVNSGRLKIYAGDGSPEYQQFWREMETARSHYRPNQTMNFFVDPARGHDDYLMSLALLVEAAGKYQPRGAKGKN